MAEPTFRQTLRAFGPCPILDRDQEVARLRG
jgi:hypothetical protein